MFQSKARIYVFWSNNSARIRPIITHVFLNRYRGVYVFCGLGEHNIGSLCEYIWRLDSCDFTKIAMCRVYIPSSYISIRDHFIHLVRQIYFQVFFLNNFTLKRNVSNLLNNQDIECGNFPFKIKFQFSWPYGSRGNNL